MPSLKKAISYQSIFIPSQVNSAKATGTIDKENELSRAERVKYSFPGFSTVLSLPVALITGLGEFWKPKLLNVLVKEGLSLIRRGDNQQDQQR